MKKLVVVADDFGLCESVNAGILEAYQHGIVTELSLMLGSPGTEHALGLVREHNIQNVGIHMLLKNWRDTGTLVHKPDYLKLFEELDQQAIARLVQAELTEFEALLGRKPSHITSQYGVIGNSKALPAAIDYAVANNVPMRLPSTTLYSSGEAERDATASSQLHKHGVATTDHFFAHILGDDYDTIRQAFLDDFATMQEGEIAEMCLHPGNYSEELARSTSLVRERQRDTKLATDKSFWDAIHKLGISIVPYPELATL